MKNQTSFRPFRLALRAALLAGLTLLAACGGELTPEADLDLYLGTSPHTLTTLDTAAFSGTVVVSVPRHPSITYVAFYLDDPYRRGAPFATDESAPFALELDTTLLDNGSHTLTAVITITGRSGAQDLVRHARFTADNGDTSTPEPPVDTTPEKRAPSTNAGDNLTVTLPDSANLNATVSDDGLPSRTLSVSWHKVSGPGA